MKTLCYHCGNVLDISEDQLEKAVVCPACNNQFCAEVFDQDSISQNKPTSKTASAKPLVPRAIEKVADVLIVINAMMLVVILVGIFWNFVDRRYAVSFLLVCNGIVVFSLFWALVGVSLVVKLANDNCARIRKPDSAQETHS